MVGFLSEVFIVARSRSGRNRPLRAALALAALPAASYSEIVAIMSGRLMEQGIMGILTEDMRRVVDEQHLGYVATVCPDGTPNLSPKGSLAVWDDDHLVFADIDSPGTVDNLRRNPAVEINVVDPLTRLGYRFKGTATIYEGGAMYEEGLVFYAGRGVTLPIHALVLIHVDRAFTLVSPAYDHSSAESIRTRWVAYWRQLWKL